MSTQRVVHVSLGTHVGGMEKLLVEFARFTDRSQFDLTFVSLQQRGDLASQIESYDCPVIAMNKTEGLKPALVARLAKTLRRIQPDVVHTHNTAAYVYGVAAAAIARVPRIIHTRHGQRFDSSRRQTMLFRGLSRWVERVVSVSSDGRQLTIDEGISPTKASTICNGVDLTRFPFVQNRPRGRAVVVARLSPEKDIVSLIRAMGILQETYGRLSEQPRALVADRNDNAVSFASPWCLDIVGDGSERSSLESISRSLGLENVVEFHGMRDDVPTVLATASLFVLPSVTEGISLTLLEAMATGLPVVACDVGGNPEVVAHEETGILVPPQDPPALAEAMRTLQEDVTVAQQYGDAGRARVETKFCVRKMVRAYETLYSNKAA